ncbi:MAG: hypothetical protein IT385_01575 [Deltaproteobacteria bacterium]|nr:hypothetical protein [Deltaproteobacteria bacterium]
MKVMVTLPLVCVLGLASARAEPVEFTAELRALSAVAACDGTPIPEGFDPKAVQAHCKDLDKIMSGYVSAWAVPARAFFDGLVPKDIPKTVVYPFGGADLLTALAVYPDLAEITSISLEAGGDPRSILRVDPKTFETHLSLHRKFLGKLVHWNHSRTLDLGLLKGTPFPSQMIFALVGLHAHGYEPVGLRAVRLEPDGQIHYFTAADLAAADAQAKDLKGSTKNRKLNDLVAGYELRFKKKGSASAPVQTYRHFQANLDNEHLEADPRILKHLEAKGKVSAITKAASYLLWWGNFKTFREQLKKQVVWMVSDSTGMLPRDLDPAVWEQTTYGVFDGSALDTANKEGVVALMAMWKAQPKRPLPFKFFGYPSRGQKGHLLVTRKK